MPRGKQIVKKGVWYIGGKKRKRKRKQKQKEEQKGKGFPFGLVASAAAPLLGEIAKPIFKKNLEEEEKEEKDETNCNFKKKKCSKSN